MSNRTLARGRRLTVLAAIALAMVWLAGDAIGGPPPSPMPLAGPPMCGPQHCPPACPPPCPPPCQPMCAPACPPPCPPPCQPMCAPACPPPCPPPCFTCCWEEKIWCVPCGATQCLDHTPPVMWRRGGSMPWNGGMPMKLGRMANPFQTPQKVKMGRIVESAPTYPVQTAAPVQHVQPFE
jgi:hypothetical protein